MINIKHGNLLTSNCNIICHQVNCQGVMGAGIAKQIREKCPEVYTAFRASYYSNNNVLGNIDIVPVTLNAHKTYICNLYAQYNIYPRNIRHTDYNALGRCLQNLKNTSLLSNNPELIIGLPFNIGCGLAGGDWNTVLKIISSELNDYNIEIYKL